MPPSKLSTKNHYNAIRVVARVFQLKQLTVNDFNGPVGLDTRELFVLSIFRQRYYRGWMIIEQVGERTQNFSFNVSSLLG